MENEIIAKLNKHLESGIHREADVVYAMAEIRKLFEHTRQRNKYPVLNFYTNWVLHTKIDRQDWVSIGLGKIVDEIVGHKRSGDPRGVLSSVTALLSFDGLRRELLELSKSQKICFNQLTVAEWRQFGELLIDVLVDCPLQTKNILKVIVELSLTRDLSFRGRTGSTVAFWRLQLKDGKQIAGPIF